MATNPNPSKLDFPQIIQRAFDESNDQLRVNATVTATLGETKITDGTNDATLTNVGAKYGLDVNILNDIVVDISHADDSIRIGDGVNLVTTTTVGAKHGLDVNILNSLSVDLDGTTATPDSVLLVGSENGTTAGNKFIFTNNLRQQILEAKDVVETLTWADFGTPQERITQVTYTSATFPAHTATKNLSYTLVGSQYRYDTSTWSVV